MGSSVNYYEHHLGDWAAATGHLTWDEDMAYTRLLRAYYHAERPIPEGQQYRLAKATTPAQRRAVDSVLAEFFTLVDGHYHQKRADTEVARFQDKQRKARASAEVRWAHNERNANAPPDAMRTHSEGNAHQTPDTRHQTQDLNHAGLRPVSSPVGDGPGALVNGSIPACPIDTVIDAYHEALPAAPRVTVRNVKRDKLISGRWRQVFADGKAHSRDEGLQVFREFFAFCGESKFLTGKAQSRDKDRAPFVADLEWLMSPTNFAKTVEGRYHR